MIYAVISVAIASLGQTLLKSGLNQLELSHLGLNGVFLARVLGDWRVILGLAGYGISAVLWIYALSKFNLSRVYPLTSLSFLFVIFLSRFALGETLSINQTVGIILVLVGLGVGSA